MALYMRNTQPSCDAASYTVKILVPDQTKKHGHSMHLKWKCYRNLSWFHKAIASLASVSLELSFLTTWSAFMKKMNILRFFFLTLCLGNYLSRENWYIKIAVSAAGRNQLWSTVCAQTHFSQLEPQGQTEPRKSILLNQTIHIPINIPSRFHAGFSCLKNLYTTLDVPWSSQYSLN